MGSIRTFSFWLCLLLLPFAGLRAQVIDELTLKDTISTGCGADSAHYYAQSYISNLWLVKRIGVWLSQAQPNGWVRLMLCKDNGAGRPDLAAPQYVSPTVNPSVTGNLYVFSSLNEFVLQGSRYWIVVDGYQIPGASGYAAVGVSASYTDTGADLIRSFDAGGSWQTLPGSPMAIFVEGDTCTLPVSLPAFDTVLCPDQAPFILYAGAGYDYYEWNTGSNDDSLAVTAPGTYHVTVVDSSGCAGTDTVTIGFYPQPLIGLDSAYYTCEGIPATIIPDVLTHDTWFWSDGSTEPVAVIPDSGVVTVVATDSNGCQAFDTTRVIFYPPPTPDIGADTSFCEGDSIQLDAGSGYAYYEWNTGDTSRFLTITAAGDYSVLVLDGVGCTGYSDTVQVTVFTAPPLPIVSQDDSLLTVFDLPGQSYQWTDSLGNPIPGATTDSLIIPGTGSYGLILTNAAGCSTILPPQVFVFVPYTPPPPEDTVFIPDGFSPNGDGVNDFFEIERALRFPGTQVLIFNRWGQEIFRSENYQNEWNGSGPGGDALPDGNYFYQVDFHDGGSPLKGVVLIHR